MNILNQNTGGMPFRKMHGLGNDFVIIDARERAFSAGAALARAIGHRNFGVGFDQLAILTAADNNDPKEVNVTFYNSDGSTAGACGNASRCIARMLFEETGANTVFLHTERGRLEARFEAGLYSVNMGVPLLNWDAVPLAREMDTLLLPLAGAPSATGMGNPHCSFFIDDIETADLAAYGQRFETDPLFPERTNVQIARLTGPDHLRIRVWERGVGVTLASGSSSCAVAVAAARRGLTGRKVQVDLDGGTLWIDWRNDGVWMTGAATHVFDGVLTPEFLDAI